MTKPLALVYYQNLLPGTQLINRLQDLGYRVSQISRSAQLISEAKTQKPLLVIAELSRKNGISDAVAGLNADRETEHIPVLAFSAETPEQVEPLAQKARVKLLVSSDAVLNHLPQLLERVLEVD